MYYLVDIEIFRTNDSTGSEYEKIQRLVKAEDKNTAYDLMKKYLDDVDVYVSKLAGQQIRYNIDVLDTILEK